MSNTKTRRTESGLVHVSVKMPKDLVDALDAHINSGAVDTDRSKVMRIALREKLGMTSVRRRACAPAGGAL